jgi:hypothetical protein
MPPQNPYQPSSPPGPVPGGSAPQPDPSHYEFIVNPGAAPKKGLGGSLSSKLIFVALGGGALVIILFVVALLGGSNKGLEPSLLTVAQQQTEIVRVAALQTDNLTSSTTKGFVLNTKLSMQTAQSDYLAFLSKNGSGINSKQLGGAQNPQTDATLTSAQANGSLDSTLTSILQDDLTQYQQTIKTAYGRTHTTLTHQELQKLYDQAGLLLQQSKQQ